MEILTEMQRKQLKTTAERVDLCLGTIRAIGGDVNTKARVLKLNFQNRDDVQALAIDLNATALILDNVKRTLDFVLDYVKEV